MNTLARKVDSAKKLIAWAYATFHRPVIGYTGGKDSTLLLHLTCEVLGTGPEAVFIDEKDTFPEIWDMVERVQKRYGVRLHVIRSELEPFTLVPVERLGLTAEEKRAFGLKQPLVYLDPDSPLGTHLFKTKVLREFVRREGVDALLLGLRRDEHPDRRHESYTRVVEGVVRVHPILDFTEEDVWNYTLCHGLPYCALYEQGYRSLGTKSGTRKFSDVPAWEQDLSTPERRGRAADKETRMALLRALGYM